MYTTSYQKLFIFGIGVTGRVLFHSTFMNPWAMPRDGARGKILGRLNNKVVMQFVHTKNFFKKEGWASDMFITSTFSVIRSRSL